MTLTPELARWRKAERERLLAARAAAPSADRERWSARIEAALTEVLPAGPGWVVGFCWPYKAEFDARGVAATLAARGVGLALPVVVGKGAPLAFHAWTPGTPMANGAYDVPVPVGTPAVVPDVLLVPPVGIGPLGDRLGYGGGFFDRTLAALAPAPIAVAHAFELSRVPTTHPQAHDVLMDALVTESGVELRREAGLVRVDAATARAQLAALARARGLPRARPG